MGGLARGYWRQTLNALDPTGEGIMGERVTRYRARHYSPEVCCQTVNPPAGNGKLKVFILAGQSNMVGYGSVENGRDPNNLTGASIPGGLGSLRHMLNANPNKYAYLADPDYPIAGGSPGSITRPDVSTTYYGGSNWDLSPNLCEMV